MDALIGILLLLPLLSVLLGIYGYAARIASGGWRPYDQWVMAAAIIATLLATWLGYAWAPPARGPIWPHVYAALAGFFTMLLVLSLGWWRRR